MKTDVIPHRTIESCRQDKIHTMNDVSVTDVSVTETVQCGRDCRCNLPRTTLIPSRFCMLRISPKANTQDVPIEFSCAQEWSCEATSTPTTARTPKCSWRHMASFPLPEPRSITVHFESVSYPRTLANSSQIAFIDAGVNSPNVL
jgi:hypothetical protein